MYSKVLFAAACLVSLSAIAAQEKGLSDRVVQVGTNDSVILRMKILQVHANQKVIDASPWHAPGGTWTFLKCEAIPTGDSCLIGVNGKHDDTKLISWGNALITVENADQGNSLVKTLAKRLAVDLPKERERMPLSATRFSTAILGSNLSRNKKGGFTNGGDWNATKWFIESDQDDAEVFFNYNLNEKIAEFVEKDSSYRDSLVGILAELLRDGPRPERTPNTDVNLSDDGPRFVNPIPLKGKWLGFTPDSQYGIYSNYNSSTSTLKSLKLGQFDRVKTLAKLPGYIEFIQFAPPKHNKIAIAIVTPREDWGISSDDPRLVFIFDRDTSKLESFRGPWNNDNIYSESIGFSADGDLIAIKALRKRPSDKSPFDEVIHIHQFSTGKSTATTFKDFIKTVTWLPDNQLEVITNTETEFGKPDQLERVLIDALTGNPTKPVRHQMDKQGTWPSADAKTTIQLAGKEKLIVQELGRTRTFELHQDDQKYAEPRRDFIQWLSPKYIKIEVGRLAFINTETLKMSFPTKRDGSYGHQFSPDFRWVIWQGPERSQFIAEVKVP